MLVLMGKSASGKDTLRDILVKKHGFHSVVTYTNRPMREGEIADVTYHYISKEEFLEKIKSGFFAEWKKYLVNDDVWYYGSAKEDLEKADEKSVIILTPDGVRDVKKNGIKGTVIYLYANLTTIRARLKNRKDTNDRAEDRIERDLRDFKGAENLANKIVYNNTADKLENIVNNVLSYYKLEVNK